MNHPFAGFEYPEDLLERSVILKEWIQARNQLVQNVRMLEERILENNDEGDTITGLVTRRIKGGLLVDVGVPHIWARLDQEGVYALITRE